MIGKVTVTSRPYDRYDQEVDRLCEYLEDYYEFKAALQLAWEAQITDNRKKFYATSPLFSYCTPDRLNVSVCPVGEGRCGCVTQVKAADYFDYYDGVDFDVRKLIRQDEHLPGSLNQIKTREQLEHLADVQRRIDVLLNREPPPLLPE